MPFFLKSHYHFWLSLHPQLKVATRELCYFAPGDCSFIHISVSVASSSLLQYLHLTLAAACLHPWPPFHGANTAHPYLRGSWGFSDMKNDTKIRYKHFPSWACNAVPQALILDQHKERQKSSWGWGSSTAAKCKSQVMSVDSHREGWLYDFKPPPIHPTLLLQSLIWLLAEQLLNCCMLQLCMLGKNQIQCQFSTVQQTVKLAASSTAAPQAAKPSLEWGSGIPFSHLPSS